MADDDSKEVLHRYLRAGREAVIWKLDGLGEYDLRRPLVPSGTNLLGLVKHLAATEAGYFGDTFGRPLRDPPAWFDDDDEPNVDMWATRDQPREQIVELYRRVIDHADATIDTLPLDAVGLVLWWPANRQETTLQHILVHMIAETHRHAGHADLVRELIDGTVGLRKDNDNMADGDTAWWADYRQRLQKTAQSFDPH
ncbi:DinB family protein [Homoserinimonas sp. OAct 916]|uniref:DinB family protein n=1 Tax=Homoserinimonas sp. OAct 916 TaxID=2211450 RepID=UPI000DBE3FD8|nr:DinB family protein [Homoserinimonas sp. OAct 916]